MTNPRPVDQSPSAPRSRREARAQRRAASGAAGLVGSWIAGVILILLGIAFFLQNLGTFVFPLDNWWALFVLIPAVATLERAVHAYRSAGNRWTATARGGLLSGVVLMLVMLILLLEFDWVIFGPVLIMLAGVGILINALLPSE